MYVHELSEYVAKCSFIRENLAVYSSPNIFSVLSKTELPNKSIYNVLHPIHIQYLYSKINNNFCNVSEHESFEIETNVAEIKGTVRRLLFIVNGVDVPLWN